MCDWQKRDYIYCIANGETHEQALRSAAINGPIEGLTVGGCKWLGNAVSNKIKAKKLPRPAVQKKSTLSEATDVQEILWGRWHDYPKVKINGNEYAEIGNRLYTRHAVARMQPSGMRYTNFSAGGKIRASRIIDASELD